MTVEENDHTEQIHLRRLISLCRLCGQRSKKCNNDKTFFSKAYAKWSCRVFLVFALTMMAVLENQKHHAKAALSLSLSLSLSLYIYIYMRLVHQTDPLSYYMLQIVNDAVLKANPNGQTLMHH